MKHETYSFSRFIDRVKISVRNFLADNKDSLLKLAAISVMIMAAFVVFTLQKSGSVDTVSIDTSSEDILDVTSSAGSMIYIDIGGAVNNPMLAELPEGSRVEDAI